MDLIEKVKDEASFLRFLRALIEDCERGERECGPHPHECAMQEHWQSHSTKDFLKSAEDWGSRGDFGEGVHHGEPMLRRIATMLYVGRYRLRDVEPRDPEWN
jgi:hypothetical protein